MATQALPSHPGPDHQISIKVLYNDSNRRFKLPLKDLQAQVLPQKVSYFLSPLKLRPDLQSAPPFPYLNDPLGDRHDR